MRFIDEANIDLIAGHGGAGAVSFRREKFIPRGGPNGGDGGKGGDVTLIATENLSTLQDFRVKKKYNAKNGDGGGGKNKAGPDGADTLIKVPVGTQIINAETNELIIDFTEDKQSWTACQGGRGGKGNAHFVTSVFQAPKFAQPGEDGQSIKIKLELKLLADVAIIGYPNAGKSTLISKMSAARPKIADYAFTTLVPNLGVVQSDTDKSFVVADIPGLIEGAHRGLGLGTRFLKHIERTSTFIHLLDGQQILELASNPFSETPIEDAVKSALDAYKAIRIELELFDIKLKHRPEILVINKLDLIETDASLIKKLKTLFRKELPKVRAITELHPKEPFFISSATGSGVKELIHALQTQLEDIKERSRVKKVGTLLPHEVPNQYSR